ncbi:hypothetical protein GGC64_006257 [Mycobacterium sp. OAS707]|uniref:GAF and ANTAR domain-containing protein n=1 Tax=Mycobacterium sp. OAS707 TaxID=2663822 RepID=UPI00178B7A9A|nr:GAF and ANTAR domain-containing protein [Mycobacterium sp. OAS707]MBE1552170.1 hypothetical protein [Mycobacterium sp. OAS707]
MADNQAHPQPAWRDAEPPSVFSALAKIVYNDSEPAEVYAAICLAAPVLVDGCDHASVMLRQHPRYFTAAASDDIARHIDTLERGVGDGPCVDAIRDETPQIEPDWTRGSSWPRLAAEVISQTPVRGAMGFRLLVNNRKVGALNLFSDTRNAFDANAADQAIVLAAFASVAAMAVARGEQAELLHHGMISNREVGKAIGMLMLLHNISDAEAFTLLRRVSQHLNVKLVDIARDVINRRGQVPHGYLPPTDA